MPNDYANEIKNNLRTILSLIKKACCDIDRDADNICLIAVSKGQSFEKIKIAYDLGLRHFGENYAQELKDKIEQAKNANLKEIKWHYIGALQTNKIKVIAQADYIHTIDSLKHAQALSKALSKEIEVFLQVKLSEQEARAGFLPHEVEHAWQEVALMPYLKMRGLMTILPLVPEKPHAFWFSSMQQLAKQHEGAELSMGMSDDFYDAVHYGATYLRIGTKLFGNRGSSKAA